MILIAGLVSLLMFSFFWKIFLGDGNNALEVPYSEFVQMLEDGKIEEVQMSNERVTFTLITDKTEQEAADYYSSYFRSKTSYYAIRIEDADTVTQRVLDKNVKINGVSSSGSDTIINLIMYIILPVLLMWILLGFLFRKMSGGGGPMGVGKSNAKVYVQKETGVTFKDVAGEDEAKESLVEVVDFLHNPG